MKCINKVDSNRSLVVNEPSRTRSNGIKLDEYKFEKDGEEVVYQ